MLKAVGSEVSAAEEFAEKLFVATPAPEGVIEAMALRHASRRALIRIVNAMGGA
jgi:hypothetical protein